MIRLLIPILLVAGVYIWFRMQAQASGAALRKQSRVLANDQLNGLFQRLAHAAGIERVEVRVLSDRTPNGLATDTGEIYVTQGFIDAFQRGAVTAQELASVAAHELGHLALGHLRRRARQVGGAQALHMVLGAVLSRVIPFFGWIVSGWLLQMFTASLSRKDEFEADAYATALMVRSGIGAEHQARLLEKLPALIPGAGDPRSWLASHPPTDERAAAIRVNAARWAENGSAIPGDAQP